MNDRLHLLTVSNDDDEAWDGIGAVLQESFHPAELRPVGAIRDAARATPTSRFVVARLDEGIVGFAAREIIGDLGYLWYMAVAGQWRGQDIGSSLLRRACADMVDAGVSDICLECEAPTSADDDDALRRIRFYERHGFSVQPCTEHAPPFNDTEPTVDYWVLSTGAPTAEHARRCLEAMITGSGLNGRHPDADRYLALSASTLGQTPSMPD